MIDDERIDSLVARLGRDGTRDEQLLLLDSLTRLPLSAQAWQRVARPLLDQFAQYVKSGDRSEDFLFAYSRVPLRSVRTQLRAAAWSKEPALARPAALALGAQQDTDALPRLVAELADNPTEQSARAIAAFPGHALTRFTPELRDGLRHPEPMVRLWLAIALAKAFQPGHAGDLEPLEQLWDALTGRGSAARLFDGPPPLFWGDPQITVGELAFTRPLPPVTRQWLLGLRDHDFGPGAPSAGKPDSRDANLLIAGLTGEFDLDGRPLPVKNPGDAPAAGSADATALREAARAVEIALASVPRSTGAVEPWEAISLGNQVLSAVAPLPPDLPIDVRRILEQHPRESMLPRTVLHWVLGRAGPERVWQALAPAITEAQGGQRQQWLTQLHDITLQLHASPPFAGAGGAAPADAVVDSLIDDQSTETGSASAGLGGGVSARPRASRESAAEAMPSAAAAAPAAAPAEAGPPDSDGERFLQGWLYQKQDSRWQRQNDTWLRVDHPHRLEVFIGPQVESLLRADTAFPDHTLDWHGQQSLPLQILFSIMDGRRQAEVRDITLPRTGTSSSADFEFRVSRAGRVRMRIAVLHEGRVVQTALLWADAISQDPSTIVTPSASGSLHHYDGRPQTEIVVHEDLAALHGRQSFQASLLLNHGEEGRASATATAGGEAYIASLDDSQAQLQSISELLQEIAQKSKVHTKGLNTPQNAAWLSRLAELGNVVYRNLVQDYIDVSPAAERLRKARYLQIVTARPDAVVPLEFAYEYPPPDLNAKLCDGADQALANRACPATCARKKDPAGHVCPMGFWGLSRVIERHVHDPSLRAEAVITARPAKTRKELVLDGPSLLAASVQVPRSHVTSLSKRLGDLSRDQVAKVESWKEWLRAVAKQPVLFVVLAHSHGSGANIQLEINGDSIRSVNIERSFVYPPDSKGSPPIVLLLGCNTAGVADMHTYARHITVFRQAKSAIVLATTAAVVWGADVAKVAEELVAQLHAAAGKRQQHFGEILRDAKCEAVRDSQLVAICLAGIGDADWLIKVPEVP